MRRVLGMMLFLFIAVAGKLADLEATLKEIAVNESVKYNCSISIAYRDKTGSAAAAAGSIDNVSTPAQVGDRYTFGSITKVLTGASVMKLVSEGKISLDDKVAPIVDPVLARFADKDAKQGFRSLADLWGIENVTDLTVYELLHMSSGVPDFDTATPCFPGKPCEMADPLRKTFYTEPNRSYNPARLMAFDWVKNSWKGKCKPFIPIMKPFCYSSTNFMILGLVLLSFQPGEASSWDDLDQSLVLPAYLKEKLTFANSGLPSSYIPVHGFDRTSYNVPKGQHNNNDNWDVAGVFSGWVASNIVGTAADIADLTWEVYGPPSSIAPKDHVQMMLPEGPFEVYGLATFNMDMETGQKGKYGRAYGHLGATYGYQSITAYFPGLEIAMTVATNIEIDKQAQPSDTLCFAYNAAASYLLGRKIHCEYTQESYWQGSCKCDPIEDTGADETIVV